MAMQGLAGEGVTMEGAALDEKREGEVIGTGL